MPIELLWIIPIVAFSFFIFLLVYFAQQKKTGTDQDLSQEVSRFNSGLQHVHHNKNNIHGDRLSELERAILTVTESISHQSQIQAPKNVNTASEIDELKKKLRELYKELDIIASENYSLRAKVKKLQQENVASFGNQKTESSQQKTGSSLPGTVNLKLYEDTRLLNLNTLEDTSEIDLMNNAD